MRIKDARRLHMEPSPRGFHTICRFALEATDGLVILDCSLVRAPDGRTLVYGPPSKTNTELLNMAPAVRREIVMMALAAAGMEKNEQHEHAA